MPAPYKKNLPYFPHDTDLSTKDKAIRLIEAEFGLKGYAVYMKLLERIYGGEGYYIEWDKDERLLFASFVGEPGDLVGEVVNGLLRRGLFNQTVFESSGVLTSRAIQDRYLNAVTRRERVELISDYLLIDINDYNNINNVNINSINTHKNKQSRVEKSKEEESRVRAPARSSPSGGKCELSSWEKDHKPLGEDDMKDWLAGHGLTIGSGEFAEELDRFRDKFSGKRYKDWQATFRNYLRNRYLEPEHWDYKKAGKPGNDRKVDKNSEAYARGFI